MKQVQVKILKNKEIAKGFYRMRIASSYLAGYSRPGQFVEVRCSQETDPLLRRPFGIHRVIGAGIELLYEVVGRGTDALSQKKPGETLDIIGPLGNGFDLGLATRERQRPAILAAGGNGVAPLFFLAEELKRKNIKIHVLIGGRSKSHILCEKEFKKLGAKVVITTDDGSRGFKGLVTNPLLTALSADDSRPSVIYACGPTGMLKAVSRLAYSSGIPCQVSLEEHMACGVGVCLGCPVKVKTDSRYKMVCKDGPVFDAGEIIW